MQKWWTGNQWLDAPPRTAKTVPLAVFIAVGILALAVGFGAGSTTGSNSSELAAAKKKISQLEAQPATNGTQPAAAESPAPAAAPPAAPAVTLSGDGEMNSKKVALNGDYSVDWKTLGSCYYSATLKTGEGTTGGETAFNAYHEASGTGNIYGLKSADYYLHVITGPAPSCGWSATLTPIP